MYVNFVRKISTTVNQNALLDILLTFTTRSTSISGTSTSASELCTYIEQIYRHF